MGVSGSCSAKWRIAIGNRVCLFAQASTPTTTPQIFARFYRAAAARTLPGPGLGLAIVRKVAETHNGTVTAERAAGGGTLLTLHIPTLPTKNATVLHGS